MTTSVDYNQNLFLRRRLIDLFPSIRKESMYERIKWQIESQGKTISDIEWAGSPDGRYYMLGKDFLAAAQTEIISPEYKEHAVHTFAPVVDEFGDPVLDDFDKPTFSSTGSTNRYLLPIASDLVLAGYGFCFKLATWRKHDWSTTPIEWGFRLLGTAYAPIKRNDFKISKLHTEIDFRELTASPAGEITAVYGTLSEINTGSLSAIF